jgi:ferredoxin-like protein FixX
LRIEIDNLTKRIPETGNFITFDSDKCNRCERCIIICIMNNWRKKDNKIYLIDNYQSKCLECAACYQVCEPGAIQFHYPAGGTGIVYEKG